MQYETDIFVSQQERNEAKLTLPELTKHPAWQFLTRVLDLNLATLRLQLETRETFKSLDELYRLQDRIADLESFKTLPETILVEADGTLPEPDDDTYDFDTPPETPAPEASTSQPS